MKPDDAHNTSGKHRKAAKADLATGQVGAAKEEPLGRRSQVLDLNLLGRRTKGGRSFVYIVENAKGAAAAQKTAVRLHKSYGSKRGGDETSTRCHTWQIRAPAYLVYVVVGHPPQPDSGHTEVEGEPGGASQLPFKVPD